MDKYMTVRDICATMILDSSGRPGIEIELMAGEAGNYVQERIVFGSADYFMSERTDENVWKILQKRTRETVEIVNSFLAQSVIGLNVFDQETFDRAVLQATGENVDRKNQINISMPVSLTAARTAAKAIGIPLYRYIGGIHAKSIPVPVTSLLEVRGVLEGKPYVWRIMLVVECGKELFDKIAVYKEIYNRIKTILTEMAYPFYMQESGTLLIEAAGVREAVSIIKKAVEKTRYKFGDEIKLYIAASPSRDLNSKQLIRYYEELVSEFPVYSLEDPLEKEDWEGWKCLTGQLNKCVHVVGGELFGEDLDRIKKGADMHVANAVLINIDKMKTLTGLFEIIRGSRECGYEVAISMYGSGTEDAFEADLAVGLGCRYIKLGVPGSLGHASKYNRLLKIENNL